jgi:hypothetical protein
LPFYFSHLLQNIYFDLGQIDPSLGLFTATTGGSTTTFLNTKWGSLPDPPEEDFIKSYIAIVVRDAGGASAAPENEYSLVSAYVESTQTATIGTLTAAPAVGDTIMLAPQDKFPVDVVMFAANRALQELGDIVLPDTSLATGANQTEYVIPLSLKRQPPIAVYYQGTTGDSDNNAWIPVTNWRMGPATAGSTGLLYLPELTAGRTILLYYKGVHPTLTAYNSPIVETVHPSIATLMTKIRLFEWWNSQPGNGQTESVDIWKEATKWPQQLAQAKVDHPIWEVQPTANGYFSTGRGQRYSRISGDLLA